MSHRGKLRTGMILPAALICLLIVMILAASVARSMIARQRAIRWEGYQQQCMWLAESASFRAVAKYRADPSYVGEEWRVTLDIAGTATPGRVVIQVEPAPDEEARRRVRLTAIWPDEPLERVTRQKDFTIPASNSGASL